MIETKQVQDGCLQVVNVNFIFGNVKAKFVGEKLIFTSYILLAKGMNEEWKIISDMPDIEKR